MISVTCVGVVTPEGVRIETTKGYDMVTACFRVQSEDVFPHGIEYKPVPETLVFPVRYRCRKEDPILKELVGGTPINFLGYFRVFKTKPYIQALKPILLLHEVMSPEFMAQLSQPPAEEPTTTQEGVQELE